ncbi:hypothetical protein MKEN_00209200 [Mycena kentingensis (nom. inval.)]|nr:hypothetical protein MKEN_00209200 [Mycena kentingensis (nom. inval.)]
MGRSVAQRAATAKLIGGRTAAAPTNENNSPTALLNVDTNSLTLNLDAALPHLQKSDAALSQCRRQCQQFEADVAALETRIDELTDELRSSDNAEYTPRDQLKKAESRVTRLERDKRTRRWRARVDPEGSLTTMDGPVFDGGRLN